VEDPLGVRRDERATLEGALDWYRAIVEHKLEDLSLDQASDVQTPTGLSVLGVVKHLALVERSWFRDVFAAEVPEVLDVADDNSADFVIDPDDTVTSVLGFYRDEAERSREIARGFSLDDVSVRSTYFEERVSLRWILVHMLEETARHAGHLDLMRERLDGRTGD